MPLRSLARNLAAAFAKVPDPRLGTRPRYPLRSILALSALAALDGAFSARDIIRWGNRLPDAVVSDLGFPGEQVPVRDTLSRIVRQIDRAAVQEALALWSCNRVDCPEWERVGVLRIVTGDELSTSVLFDLDPSAAAQDPERRPEPDLASTCVAVAPPLRRWKRTHAVL